MKIEPQKICKGIKCINLIVINIKNISYEETNYYKTYRLINLEHDIQIILIIVIYKHGIVKFIFISSSPKYLYVVINYN